MKNAELLIEAVRSRPFLYDQSVQTFRHLGTKNRNWMQVAKLVYGREDKTTVNRVKIQWKSLRDAFVKQQRKRQNGLTVKPYIYENEMQFLMPHILIKDRDETSPDNVPVAKFEIKMEDSVSLNASLSEDSQPEIEAETQVTTLTQEYLQNHQRLPLQTDPISEPKDMHPVDAFFHGIAQTVKQLKPSTIARLKKSVANIVMDAEIEELETNVKSYS